MLVDTHCHLNIMVKKQFDTSMTKQDIATAHTLIQEAADWQVTRIINVGTSVIESINCVQLSKQFEYVYAAVGIHPNDLTADWQKDLKEIEHLAVNKQKNKIVGIGECGLDFHYPDYKIGQQKDAFKAQIELALNYDLALIVHTRDARDETLYSLEEYHKEIKHCIIHCYSEDADFAKTVTQWGFYLGIGGTLTYPKNDYLRAIVQEFPLTSIVLETDAPFLPIQSMRGKQNHPKYIKTIAEYIGQLRNQPFEEIARITTENVSKIFRIG